MAPLNVDAPRRMKRRKLFLKRRLRGPLGTLVAGKDFLSSSWDGPRVVRLLRGVMMGYRVIARRVKLWESLSYALVLFSVGIR